MERIIAKLLTDFESGKMTRRQLIQSLALTATAASAAMAAPAAAAAPDGKGFKAIAVNHISYEVADYAKTRDFYSDLLGMKVLQDDGKQCFLAFGETFLIPRGPRKDDKPPYVYHFAITIENWNKDAVEAELNRRGLQPKPDTKDSFHIKDPNGYDLQICGADMKP
jgi:catechol 2,3-dioxygenase-like lactoylglutathione lyase family enzyme